MNRDLAQAFAQPAGLRARLSSELATAANDPDIYALLKLLPNPDPILRKSGHTQEIFQDMLRDPHILSEVSAMRSGLLSFEYKSVSSGNTRADRRALALCEELYTRQPAPFTRWPDIIWQIAQAELYGYRAHEVIWGESGGYLIPIAVKNRPNRRIGFSHEGEPRLRTRLQPVEGEPLEQYKWLIARHMGDAENPYGVAKLSACFWAWVFKHGGFKAFVRLAERFGIPWTVIKYPPSATADDVANFVDTLTELRDSGVLAYPDTGQLDVVDPKSTGEIHSNLIDLCNREISKCLRSQTLATEIQGSGSRAAAETHRAREQGVDESTRALIAATFTQLHEWIVKLNIPGAVVPQFIFYQEESPRTEWVDALEKARHFMRIPADFAHAVTNIPRPADNDDVLPGVETIAEPDGIKLNQQFSAQGNKTPDEWIARTVGEADSIMENEVFKRLAEELDKIMSAGGDLAEFQARIPAMFPDLASGEAGRKLAELNTLAGIVARMNGIGEGSA
jgi:phage gp29-like protein